MYYKCENLLLKGKFSWAVVRSYQVNNKRRLFRCKYPELIFIGIVSKGSICARVNHVERNSAWKGHFLLNLSHKLSSATATATF